jgi:hypothetical protein
MMLWAPNVSESWKNFHFLFLEPSHSHAMALLLWLAVTAPMTGGVAPRPEAAGAHQAPPFGRPTPWPSVPRPSSPLLKL